MALTPQQLFAHLDALGIAHRTIEHPPLFTVEDSAILQVELPEPHIKNLFVKDKKGRYFLLVALAGARIDLKRVHELIGAHGRVSFGSPEQLEALWGVTPGSVTPFGAINDVGRTVTVVLEASLMAFETVNAHPLVNTMTTGVSREGLLAFLRDCGHEPLVIAFAQGKAGD